MFEKKKCERCGKEYRANTASETRGKHICPDCCKHCSDCGTKLSMERWFGQTSSVATALFTPMVFAQREYLEKPWIGSGLCVECYGKKLSQEEEEQRLLKEAKLARAREILETPTVWECGYCKTVNRGKFCANCGSPKKKQEIRKPVPNRIVPESSKKEYVKESNLDWYQEALAQHIIQTDQENADSEN